MIKNFISIIFALFILFSVPVISHAEFGEFAGDSDYGFDSGGGFDSGDNDSGNYGFDYDNDDDDDYKYASDEKKTTSYYSYVSGSHSDDDSFDGYYDSKGNALTISSIQNEDDTEANYSAVLGAIVLGAIIIIVFYVRRSKRNTTVTQNYINRPVNQGAIQTPVDSLTSMSEYISIDPGFSETELKEKISNVYIQMQNCWQAKNLEQLRPYFTDSLFAQYDRQLEPYRKNNQTNCVDRIAILGIVLKGWRRAGNNDEIVATVRTRIVDYVIDDNTKAVIRGDKNKEKFMTYEFTLTRKSGVKTTSDSGTRSVTCPHCGAPININKSAKCEYCGSIVTVDSNDWVINEIKGIAQRTK